MSETRMRLRSSVSAEDREAIKNEHIKKEEERKNMPFIEYKQKIKYCREFIDCAIICDELIKIADSTTDLMVIGFDLEWPFNFQTGPGRTAVMQIYHTLTQCVIIQISDLKKLPKSMNIFLSHQRVRITGVNIKNDVRKLSRDFTGFDVDKLLENCIDSGVLANSILPFKQRWSMEKLVRFLLKMKINKDTKVRMSKWHVSPLSTNQLTYAATDAYASLLLYNHLKTLEASNIENDKNNLN